MIIYSNKSKPALAELCPGKSVWRRCAAAVLVLKTRVRRERLERQCGLGSGTSGVCVCVCVCVRVRWLGMRRQDRAHNVGWAVGGLGGCRVRPPVAQDASPPAGPEECLPPLQPG